MKHYKNQHFSFALPDEWPNRDESDDTMSLTVFEKPGENTRLTISMRIFDLQTPQQKISEAFKEFVHIRRQAEIDICEDPKDIILTPENIVDQGSFLYSKYAGIHGPMDRRLAALLTAENGKMLCFYVESTGTTDQYFNDLSNSIFNSIDVT